MLKEDLDTFTNDEKTELDDSFAPRGLAWRSGQTIAGGILMIGAALALYYFDVSRLVLTGALVMYALVFTIEKLSYARALVGARSTVRKLVRRVEDLEGVQQTPDNAQPSRRENVVDMASRLG